MRRTLASILTALAIVLGCVVCVASASADVISVEGGLHYLRNPAGEVVKTWTTKEWESWTREVQNVGECVGLAGSCSAAEMAAHTPVEDATLAGTKDAEAAVDLQRSEIGARVTEWGSKDYEQLSLLQENAGFDVAGEASGVLTSSLGVSTLGTVLMGAGAAVLGVEIGNGLDQLFGLPQFNPFSEGEKEVVISHGIVPDVQKEPLEYKEHISNTKGEVIEVKKKHTPAGIYLNWFADAVKQVETSVVCAKTKPFGECHVSVNEGEACPNLACIPEPEKYQQVTIITQRGSNEGIGVESEVTSQTRWYRAEEECSDEGLTEIQIFEGGGCLVPLGIPAPGLLTKSVEESNVEHGAPAHPKALAPTLPTHPPDTVKEKEVREITEIPPPRKKIEEGRTHKKEQEEEEEKELVVPLFGDELGTDYVKKLEELGFTDVKPTVLPDVNSDPARGPSQVTTVSPSPGTRVSSDAPVEVDINPSDAPLPETRTPVGGPTLPGIKFPHFSLLCTTFPFGVPCWLVKQVEAFSASAAAPIWKIGPFKWGSTEIPGAEVHLSKLEPVMEVIRPFMVLFGTIGIVLMFYKIFTGKSLGGGENPAGQVPDPEGDYPFTGEYEGEMERTEHGM